MSTFPRQIGRYKIVGRVGAGGMGSVFRGFDPELERPVAVKLLHGRFSASQGAHARLAREAKALAAVSHANVIIVYEVGEFDGKPFIAMEYVDSRNLKSWVRADEPPWREVLEVYLQAGAGLAAAHARGVIHRDVKPTNVLFGHDGRVRVVDFGLARVGGEDSEDVATEPTLALEHGSGSFDQQGVITATGALVGTPAYMAPEQHLLGVATEQSDQFGFCVSIWESLFEERPFPATSSEEFLRSIRAGAPRPRQVPAGLPRRVISVLRRGLSLDPARRWGSMAQLCAELSRAIARGRGTRRLLVSAATVATLALTSYSFVSADDGGADARCPAADELTAPVWGASQRAVTQSKFDEQGRSDDGVRFDGFVRDYLASWEAGFTEACAAPTPDPAELTCLRHRLDVLAGVVEVVDDADASGLAASVEAASALPPVQSCSAAAGPAPSRTDPALASELSAARSLLARSRASILAGRFDEAATMAADVASVAHRIEQEPLLAEARLQQGRAAAQRPEGSEDALAWFEEAHALALEVGDAETAMKAALQTSVLLTNERGDFRAALRWWRSAEAASERGNLPLPVNAHISLGVLYQRLGRNEEMGAALEAAIEQAQSKTPETPSEVLANQRQLGKAYSMLGRRNEAIEVLTGAQELARRTYGEGALVFAHTSMSLASEYNRDLQFKEAEPHLRAALVVIESHNPPPHYRTADARIRVATSLMPQGKLDEGIELFEQAEREMAQLYPPTHDRMIYARITLADGYYHARRLDEAEALLDSMIADVESEFGPNHSNLAEVLCRRGRTDGQTGDAQAALGYYERGIEIFRDVANKPPGYFECLGSLTLAQSELGDYEKAVVNADELRAMLIKRFGPDHQVTLDATSQMLRAYRAVGRAGEFVGLAEKAVERLRENGVDEMHVALAEFELARTLMAANQQQARAVELARAAREVFRADERAEPADLEKLDAFIEKYRR